MGLASEVKKIATSGRPFSVLDESDRELLLPSVGFGEPKRAGIQIAPIVPATSITKHTAQDMNLPDFVVHADWGASAGKRQVAVAERENGNYVLCSPEGIEDISAFRKRLAQRSSDSCVVVGFDFPIGVPEEYARRAGISRFPDALSKFGRGEWSDFYKRAKRPDQISLHRPFYPHNPGRKDGVEQSHLLDGLGITDKSDLLRRCERKTEERGEASMLFWLVGPKQAGNAARIGWKEVLAPLYGSDTRTRIWPFDGEMESVLANEGLVVVETYPAEAGHHLGLAPNGWSKNSQEDRRDQSDALFRWAERRRVKFAPDLRASLSNGFGNGKHGEDRFDTVVGLGSMIEVLLSHRPEGTPQNGTVQDVEGWIFGQTARD